MMNELDIYESLSDKTVAELVKIIIQLSKLITELEMEVQICRENKKQGAIIVALLFIFRR